MITELTIFSVTGGAPSGKSDELRGCFRIRPIAGIRIYTFVMYEVLLGTWRWGNEIHILALRALGGAGG